MRWLAVNAPRGGSIVLEATGGQYSQFARVSSSTGVPTVLGWAGHEVQWRGNDRLFRDRGADIDRIYQSLDKSEVRPLLEKYSIDYVYVGGLERGKYPANSLDAFKGSLDVAFENLTVTIYRTEMGPSTVS